MIFKKETNEIFTDCGEFIKKLECPLDMKWSDLDQVDSKDTKRFCRECKKLVLNTDGLSDDQIVAIVRYDEDVCLYINKTRLLGPAITRRSKLRLIKTAKDVDCMNLAVLNGYRPLIKKVETTDKIKSKTRVCQNKENGFITLHGDFRDFGCPKGSVEVLPMHWHTNSPFPNSFAAYLVPADIKVGERVILEEVIEELVGLSWNQGDTYRLKFAEATWNGTDFEIDYDENNINEIIG